MRRILALAACTALLGCPQSYSEEPSPSPEPTALPTLTPPEKVRPWIELGEASAQKSVEPEEPEESRAPDLYDGWASRCEPMARARACRIAADCKDVFHPSGKPLKCVKPWWSKQQPDGAWDRVCSPGWSDREERQWRRDRLKALVAMQYFSDSVTCTWKVEGDTWRDWDCYREIQNSVFLSKFLWLVYARETTGRPWKRHRLDVDVKAAKTSWFKQAERYGWVATKGKKDSVTLQSCAALPPDDKESRLRSACRALKPSPHYAQRKRWNYGLGPYGQSAAVWVFAWDRQAPPEVLCGEVEPTEAYLRGARRAWKKLRGGIQCKGVEYKPDVTWAILHRAAAGGKLCPGPSDRFRKHAAKWGLDPDQHVTLKMLGKPIDREGQLQRAEELASYLDASYPSPFG